MGAVAVGRVAAAAAAVALLVLGAGCGERSEPTGSGIRLYPVTVQTAGDRPLIVRAAARRIAVLDEAAGEILNALGAGDRIAGAPLDSTGGIRFAVLRRLEPDLVVAAAAADERDLSRAADATGAPVYTAPGDSIRQVERAITQLGLLTARPVEARALVRAIERRRREVGARLAQAPRVSVFVDTGFFTTVSDQELLGDLIREARGRNVAGPSPEPGPFDLAELVALDPDVYLATSDSGVELADLRRDPRTRKLTAVREERFAVAGSELLVPGPRIGEGLEEIARLLHPDAFR